MGIKDDIKSNLYKALDAYSELRKQQKDSVRPDMQELRGEKQPGMPSAQESAAQRLHNAESDATKNQDGVSGADDSTDATKNREEKTGDTGSGFRNNIGKNKNSKKGLSRFTGKGKSKGKGKLNAKALLTRRGGGAVGLIVTLILLCIGVATGSQSMMGFSIANRLIEEKNSMGSSNHARYNNLFHYLAAKDKLSSSQKKALAEQGIEVKTKGHSSTVTFEYTHTNSDGTTEKRTVDVNKDAGALDKALNEHPELKQGYNTASQKWKGQNSGWYDRMSSKIFSALGLKNLRNHFQNYQDTGDAETNKTNVQKAAKNETSVNGANSEEVTTTKDKDGNTKQNPPAQKDDTGAKHGESKATIKEKFKNLGKSGASSVADVYCGVLNALGAISNVVVAQQMLEMMNLAGAYLESVQKVQAGDGSTSPMNVLNQQLTQKVKPESSQNDTQYGERSAMESTGMSSLFNKTSGAAPNDSSTLSANIESLTNKVQVLGIDTALTTDRFSSCAYARVGQGVVSAITDATGVGKIGRVALEVAAGFVLQPLIDAALDGVIEWAAGIFMRKLVTDAVGEDMGNAIVSGGTEVMSKNHQGSGGSPGTKDKVIAYRQQQQAVIAEQAEYDRATLSPFDITSRHTFLGSLAYMVLPKVAIMTSSTGNVLSQTNAILSSAVGALSPTANAVATTDLDQYEGNCPMLQSVGSVGDAFCNPYYITDTSTVNEDMDTILNKLKSWGDIDNTDTLNPTINKSGDLAKYQQFCGNRQSTFGVADAAIASHFDSVTGNATVDTAASMIPIAGGVLDAINGARSAANQDWVSGKKCIAGATSWWDEKGKYYQRFTEDHRLLTDTGVIGANTEYGESHILALGDAYRDSITADQSYEAQIARLSGMTKAQVTETLALMEEYQFLANYDPTDLGPLKTEPSTPQTYDFSSGSEVAQMNSENPVYSATNSAQAYIVYADLRTRTQVA